MNKVEKELVMNSYGPDYDISALSVHAMLASGYVQVRVWIYKSLWDGTVYIKITSAVPKSFLHDDIIGS